MTYTTVRLLPLTLFFYLLLLHHLQAPGAVSSVEPASTSPPHPLPPHIPEEKEVDVNVARWIEERDILLQTGVRPYYTIQRLDQRITEKLAERTQ